MPPKKDTKGKKKALRGMMDVFKDASRKKSALGVYLLNEIQKEHVKAKDIHKKLVDWEYRAVRLQDVTWLLKNYKSLEGIQAAVLEKGY